MYNQQILDQIILQLKQMHVSSEEMEYIVKQVGVQPLRNDSKISRLEVINHAENDMSVGRVLTLHREIGDFKSLELSYQDGGRTLKIFLG
jgi:hypothetical protein